MAANQGWLARAPARPGQCAAGPRTPRTAYFYNPRVQPVRPVVGAARSDGAGCAPSPSPSPSIDPCASSIRRRRRPVGRARRSARRPPSRPSPHRGADGGPDRTADRGAHRAADARADPGADARAHAEPTPSDPTRRAAPRPSRTSGRVPRTGASQHLLRIPAYDPPGRGRFEGPAARAVVDLSPSITRRCTCRIASRAGHAGPARRRGPPSCSASSAIVAGAPGPTRHRRRRPHRHDAVPGGRRRAGLHGVVQRSRSTSRARARSTSRPTASPSGWTARFRGGGLTIDGAYVDPKDPPDLTLDVEIPDGATASATRSPVDGDGRRRRPTRCRSRSASPTPPRATSR